MLSFKSVNTITILIALLLAIVYLFFHISGWWFLLLGIVWFTLTSIGSFNIQWNYHFTSLLSNPKTEKKQVAITFDDGPNPEFTPKVLELLNRFNVKATFFCIGKNAEKHPELFKKIIDQGHTVGNHTYSHSNNFGFFSSLKVKDELQRTNTVFKEVLGVEPKLYRPAFGVTNPRIKRALKNTKLISVGWNKRSLDTTKLSKKAIVKRIVKDHKKGDVVLLHDTSEKSVQVLEQYLLFLQRKKTVSVTIDQLFKIQPYV